MRKLFLLCVLLVTYCCVFAQSKPAVSDSVLYVIDGVKHFGEPKLDKKDILEIAVYHDAADVVRKKYGADADKGVIEIKTTLAYRVKTYRKLLSDLSPGYKYFIDHNSSDTGLQYIVQKKADGAYVMNGGDIETTNFLYKLKAADIEGIAANVVPGSNNLKLFEVVISLKK